MPLKNNLLFNSYGYNFAIHYFYKKIQMKKIFIAIFLLLPAIAFLQPSRNKNAPYFSAKGYPDLKLLLTDSTTIFTKNNLPKDKTIVIIFFSPECEHCQAEATKMMEKTDSLQNLFMVWNANMVDDFSNVKQFYAKYGFDKMGNAAMGKEIDYYLPIFYSIEQTPYAAVYKNEKLIAEFRNTLSLENLIAINYDKYIAPPPVKTVETKKKKKKGKG